ncbi:class I SAM-dependent methyltransferase [Paenibacillus paeoniae]|uniref:Class I SAM-dependent methyltransferase n=1 Tax=Paenibacillus paeoniae TaxID=2292705 RepID=A0A371PMJ7_9BACL|nr:class I SAM-dependent methyltransferase [Paenibacillus paeoniae]REK77007.1 class I SAM-dependent methyltransferase [Paenibacillus paeoniae]
MSEAQSELYDAIYSFKNYEQEAAVIKELIDRKHPNARTILDVACGTGKHASFLQLSYVVDGIDLNESHIEAARKRNPKSQFTVDDMTNFQLNRTYDVITCLFSSIGFAKTLVGVEQAVRRFKEHLKPDGILLIEAWFTPDDWQPGYVSTLQYESEDCKISRMSHSSTVGSISVLHFDYLIGRRDGIQHVQETLELGLFSREELTELFISEGLCVEYDEYEWIGRGMYILRRE